MPCDLRLASASSRKFRAFLMWSRMASLYRLFVSDTGSPSGERPAAVDGDDAAGGILKMGRHGQRGGADFIRGCQALQRGAQRLLVAPFLVEVLDEVRVYQPGGHRYHPDLRGQGAGERLRHRVGRGLGSAIPDVAAHRRDASNGRDVDDQPVAARLKEFVERTHGGERSTPVHAKDIVDQLVVQRIEIVMGNKARNAGAVHQHVDLCVLGQDLASQRVERRGVIDRNACAPVPVAGQCRDEVFRRALTLVVGDNARRTRFRKVPAYRGADGTGTAGDDADLSLQRKLDGHDLDELLEFVNVVNTVNVVIRKGLTRPLRYSRHSRHLRIHGPYAARSRP